MSAFPNDVDDYTPWSPGQYVEEDSVNELQDGIEAIQENIIGGYHRDGILDLNMQSDPNFDQSYGGGSSQIVYDAVNKWTRITVPSSADFGVYKVLPDSLKFTPAPSAVVEMKVNFIVSTLGYFNDSNVFIGFFDHDDPDGAKLGLRMTLGGGGALSNIFAIVKGSSGYTAAALVAIGAASTPYHPVINWQNPQAICLDGTMYNYSTGATITSLVDEFVTVSTHKDTELPDFGIAVIDNIGTDTTQIDVLDLYARVKRS